MHDRDQQPLRTQLVGELGQHQNQPVVRDLFVKSPADLPLTAAHPAPERSIVRARRGDDGRAHVEELLAPADSALASMYRLAAKHQLNPAFPDVVEAEVQRISAAPGIDDPELEDLSDVAFVTIDGPDTRDLDQALHVERAGKGHRVRYALADPAYWVRPGTALFEEALRRGASYYLPGLSIPMLPRALSEGIISLNENVLRRALVFDMHVDPSGRCTNTRLRRARMRSRAKLSFGRVQRFLDDPKAHSTGDADVDANLIAFEKLGQLRLRDAERRDIVRYRRVEVEVKLTDRHAVRFVITDGRCRGEVERYNEQLSLLCNIEGARLLRRGDQQDDDIQPIYRVHPSPARGRYNELEQLLDAIIKAHGLDPNRWRWRRGSKRSLADYLRDLPSEGTEGRIAKAVHRQAILLNLRSTFSEKPGRHFGIGAEIYARFSAPMREIVGVFLHKEALEKTAGVETSEDQRSTDESLREQIVERANESKLMQKQLTKAANLLVLDQLFEADLELPKNKRPRRIGTVMGMTRGKAHVVLDSPPIELKIYTRHLEQQLGTGIDLSADRIALSRQDSGKPLCRIGDSVKVWVTERDRGGNRWALALAPLE